MNGALARGFGLLLRGAIRVYQLTVASFFVGACRFEPSCSFYAAEAIAAHGPARGSLLAVRRLCRCHPWAASGYDPVPPRSGNLACVTAGNRTTPLHE